ncbi:MAG: hypothetical protein IT162_11985 [Bryobacterales bacterium]|nr:hypothetical protein [Bryobacterales bacterium]
MAPVEVFERNTLTAIGLIEAFLNHCSYLRKFGTIHLAGLGIEKKCDGMLHHSSALCAAECIIGQLRSGAK